MAKDPAFLFYPGDWNLGTMHLTLLEKGCYMELLILQFAMGKFTEAQAKHMLNGSFDLAWPTISAKFITDGTFFWNERLSLEKEKRKKFTDSRKSNGSIKKKRKHMEDANKNEIEVENELLKREVGRGEVMVYNAETEITKNHIKLEQMIMNSGKDLESGKLVLKKYHLYLEEKDQYPRTKKSVWAGFEKWLLNEKKYTNDRHIPTPPVVGKTLEFDKP